MKRIWRADVGVTIVLIVVRATLGHGWAEVNSGEIFGYLATGVVDAERLRGGGPSKGARARGFGEGWLLSTQSGHVRK